MESFTGEELTAIKELRKNLTSFLESGADAEEKQEPVDAAARSRIRERARDHMDNSTLWRYCQAHAFDLNQAQDMFTHSMVWKEEVGIEKLFDDFSGRQRGSYSVGQNAFYGGILDSCTVQGGPVLIERLGKLDVAGLSANEAVQKDCIAAYTGYLEDAWRRVRKAGKKIRGLIVVDLQGLSMSLLWHISLIKKITSIGPPNYPEITMRVCIVRAPTIFSMIWKAVVPFLPSRTKDKVKVLGNSEYLAELSEYIEGGEESIPDFLGGKLTDHSICPAMKVSEALQGS
mmetsp:Transcript_39424/g.77557  ORF Transcript_39424/g.77557 Transcript_39424/m.77557 type:complete len:287 (-) Transcript_39424:264-1124(-)|eukprot:CAMPEP_0175136704 /NCGR_PEP_ID=MMETSP0087-20121206/9423_1 /TAXON_ID=136419 /ORGANISM="Unknown Unknown, Strain D1" /LENGTH=286 /DNA_ID=CAMNT_0016419489 /DNA_START=798 /DNA_END=1658 /DNA_ORIENTATION=+